jgi:hypothetical protein
MLKDALVGKTLFNKVSGLAGTVIRHHLNPGNNLVTIQVKELVYPLIFVKDDIELMFKGNETEDSWVIKE